MADVQQIRMMTADEKLFVVLSEDKGIKTPHTFLVEGDEWQGEHAIASHHNGPYYGEDM